MTLHVKKGFNRVEPICEIGKGLTVVRFMKEEEQLNESY